MVVGGGEIAVYDSAGSQVGTIGRAGKGPFEFSSFFYAAVAADGKIHVVDPLNARRTILSSDGEPQSSSPLPARIESFALLHGGGLITQSPRTPRTPTNAPLFIRVDSAGDVQGEFGRAVDSAGSIPDRWVIAPDPRGTVWSGDMLGYELTEWSESGHALRTLVGRRNWLTDPDHATPSSSQTVPAMLLHVRVADDGLIWLFFGIPTGVSNGQRESRVSADAVNEMLKTHIEIVDPETPELVTSADFDNLLMPVCGTDYVHTVRNTSGGDTRMTISRLVLQRE